MWPDAEKTQDILDEVRDGDQDAVGRLLQRHRESIRRLVDLRLDRKIRQRVDASDIVQEAMVEANRRLATYLENPIMPFRVWLRQIAKDRVIDAHRRHHVSSKRSVDREQAMVAPGGFDRSTVELVAHLCDGERTPQEAAVMNEMMRRFEDAIEEMEDVDREIVMMRHIEQLTNSEVAQALNLSEAAASMRLLRATRRLRKKFGTNDEEQA